MSHPLFPYLLVGPEDLSSRPQFAAISSDEIESICQAVSDDIETILERKILQRTYTAETYESNGTFSIRLRNPPIVSISEIRRDGQVVDLTSIRIVDSATGRLYNPARWGPRPVWDQGAVVGLSDPVPSVAYSEQYGDGSRPILWEFDYVGGFAVVPYVIRHAAIEAAVALVSGPDSVGIKSETIGSYSYSLDGPTADNPNGGKIPSFDALLRYRIAPGIR